MKKSTLILSISLIVAILLALWFYYQAFSYSRLNASLQKELEVQEVFYKAEIAKATTALKQQNEAIEIYQADIEHIQQSIKNKTHELTTIREQQEIKILEELARDSSSDNQLNILDRVLHDFSK